MAKRIERVDIESGDVFGGLKKSAKDANQDVELLSKTLKVISDEIESVKTKAKGLVIKMNPSNLADIEAQNKAEKEAIRLANERAKLETTQFRLATMKTKEQERLAKQQERQNKAQAAENSAYAQASKRLNELRKSYKDLAIQGRENESASKAMKKEIIELDATLKRVDGSVGQYQRNVGNYSSAFSKLSGVLGTLGVGISAGALFGSATRTVVEFDQAIADLVSITGASGKDLEFFKKQSAELGVSVKGGASAVIEAYKLIGSAKPELLSNAQALDAVTQSAITLSKASGMDLPSAATALTDAMNQFGASADEAEKFINVLGAGAKFGSAEIPQITEALLRFGAVAKTSNVNIEESTALIEALAERGLKGADAGTALRNVMLKLGAPDALPKEAQERMQALGISFDKLRDTSIPFSERLDALKPLLKDNAALVKVFGTENAVAATNLLTSTDRIKELNEQVTGTDTAFEQANQRTKTLSQAFVEFKGTFEKIILDFYNGTGAGEGFASVLNVITKNLPSIISGIGKLAIGFATFKTVTAVANTDFKSLISNFTKFKVEADDAGGKMSGFGNALKGIGWTVAIGLAIDLGLKLWDVASGAAAAREAMARFQQQVQKGSKESASNVASIQEAERQIVAKLNEQLKNKKINQDEYNKAVKQAQINSENELKANIKSANERKKIYKDQLQELERLEEKLSKSSDNDKTIKTIDELTKKASEIAKELNITGNKAFGFLDQDATYTQVMAQLKANIAGTNERLKTYHGALKEADDATKDFTVQTSNGNKTLGESKKAVKELTDEEKRRLQALKDLADFEQEQLDKQKAKDDARLARQEEYGQLLEEANKTTREYSMTEMEKELQAVEDKYRRMEDLSEEFGYGQEEILEARLNEENAIRAKYDKIERDQKKENDEKIAQQEKEALEKRRQERRKFVSDVLDEMKELSQAEEQRIDDRIKAEQDLQNNLQAQANAGNISAQQSIEASREAERKATLEKQKEQRKQQRIEDVKTLLNIINQNIDKGDSVPIATTKGIASLGIIKAVAKGLSGFAKGTEWRLGQEHKAQLSGVDGHIVKVDSSEAIVKGSLMDKAEKAGISSTDELVNLAVMQKMNDQTNGFQPSMTVGYKIDTSGIERRLESIEKAIESKTETQFDPYILNGLAKGIVKTERKGNFTRKTLYKG